MMMELLCRAVGLALVGSFLSMILKKETPAISFVIAFAAAAALVFAVIEGLNELRAEAEALLRTSGLEENLVRALLKITLTTIVSKGVADICRDAGQSAAAYFMELCGIVCALILAIPVFRGLIEAIGNMFG